MMRWVVGSSLRFRFVVLVAGAAMMFFGGQKLRAMPVDAFPEFAQPRVEIQTTCLGLSAAEVESLVTVPMEQVMQGMPGLDLVRSKSIPQLSSIELLFKPGTDIFRARQLVAERVATIGPTLPTWAAPPFIMPTTSTTSRVMKIGVSSKTLPLTQLSTIAYWKIRARLLRVPGVANVALWGEHLQQLHVLADPPRMRAHDVSLEQVMETTADSLNAVSSGSRPEPSSARADSSTPRISASRSSTSSPSSPLPTWPPCRSRGPTARASASARSPTWPRGTCRSQATR